MKREEIKRIAYVFMCVLQITYSFEKFSCRIVLHCFCHLYALYFVQCLIRMFWRYTKVFQLKYILTYFFYHKYVNIPCLTKILSVFLIKKIPDISKNISFPRYNFFSKELNRNPRNSPIINWNMKIFWQSIPSNIAANHLRINLMLSVKNQIQINVLRRQESLQCFEMKWIKSRYNNWKIQMRFFIQFILSL